MSIGYAPVRCESCGMDSSRIKRDDGTLKPCRRCGGAMQKRAIFEDRKIEKAKAELRQMGQI